MASSDKVQSEQRPEFPANWRITADYDPNDHLINLKGKEYLNVQNRMLWFIRDQRAFTVAGLAQVPYVVRTELVELDREAGYAHYKTYVRDVLGNEATMYGSESAKDFGDYAEKASTKSLGRALLALGYGTAFAPEMDEGERIVDAPVETKRGGRQSRPEPVPQVAAQVEPIAARAPVNSVPNAVADQPATEQQFVSIRKLCAVLGKPEPETKLTYGEARQLITQLSGEYQRARRAS
jgi:hypothetical protein